MALSVSDSVVTKTPPGVVGLTVVGGFSVVDSAGVVAVVDTGVVGNAVVSCVVTAREKYLFILIFSWFPNKPKNDHKVNKYKKAFKLNASLHILTNLKSTNFDGIKNGKIFCFIKNIYKPVDTTGVVIGVPGFGVVHL